jgi:hypothetical protein
MPTCLIFIVEQFCLCLSSCYSLCILLLTWTIHDRSCWNQDLTQVSKLCVSLVLVVYGHAVIEARPLAGLSPILAWAKQGLPSTKRRLAVAATVVSPQQHVLAPPAWRNWLKGCTCTSTSCKQVRKCSGDLRPDKGPNLHSISVRSEVTTMWIQ